MCGLPSCLHPLLATVCFEVASGTFGIVKVIICCSRDLLRHPFNHVYKVVCCLHGLYWLTNEVLLWFMLITFPFYFPIHSFCSSCWLVAGLKVKTCSLLIKKKAIQVLFLIFLNFFFICTDIFRWSCTKRYLSEN